MVALSRNGLQLSPKGTRFQRRAILGAVGSVGFFVHKNRTALESSSGRAMFKNAFSMSAIHAIRFSRKRMRTANKSGFRLGPVSKQSLREGPYLPLAEPSKTGRILLVALSSLITG